MDTIVALSQYCKDSYAGFFDLPHDKFSIIGNAVDKEVFYPGQPDERDPNIFVYASAPCKGMYPLQFAFANLKRNQPKARLLVYANQ